MGDREDHNGKRKFVPDEESCEWPDGSARRTRLRTTGGPGGQNGADGNRFLPPLDQREDPRHNLPGPQQLPPAAQGGGGGEGVRRGGQRENVISEADRRRRVELWMQDPDVNGCLTAALKASQHRESGGVGNPGALLPPRQAPSSSQAQHSRIRQQGQGLLMPLPSSGTSHDGARGRGLQVSVQAQAPAHAGQPGTATTGASGSGQPQPRANAGIFYECPACHNDPSDDQCLLCGRKPEPVNLGVDPPNAPEQGLPAAPTSRTTLAPLPPNTWRTGARLAATMVPQPRPQAPSSFQAPRIQQPYIGPSFPRTHISDYLPQGQGFPMRVPIRGAQSGNTSGDCSYGRGLQITGQPRAATRALGSGQPQPPSWMQNPEVIRSLMAALDAAHHRESSNVGNQGTLMPPPQARTPSSSSQMQMRAPAIAAQPGAATGALGSGQPQLPSWTQDPKVIHSLMAALDAAHHLESGSVGNQGTLMPPPQAGTPSSSSQMQMRAPAIAAQPGAATGALGSGQPQLPSWTQDPKVIRGLMAAPDAAHHLETGSVGNPSRSLPDSSTGASVSGQPQHPANAVIQCPACRSRPGWAAPYPWLHFCLCDVCHLSRVCPWCARFLPPGYRLRR